MTTPKQNTIDEYVSRLNLQPHPEGGFYKETYRASTMHSFDDFEGERNISTGIYFMLTAGNFSAFHRIKSDEMWHFYDGDALNIYVIHTDGKLEILKLGRDISHGESPQLVVPAGAWFASEVSDGGDFALVGCTVSPGFDFQDFEMAKANALVQEYPDHELIIKKLTRD